MNDLVFRVFRCADVQCHWQSSVPVSALKLQSERSRADSREVIRCRGSQ